MFKKISYLSLILFIFSSAACSMEITKEKVTDLVNRTASEIKTDTQSVFTKISNGEHPYKDKDNPQLYVFVYNTDVEIVAHYKKHLVGRSYKGLPDVRGKNFRDDIVNGAIKNKSGWTDYSYQKPGEKGIHRKTTYYMLVSGSDGEIYIVCAGRYID